MDHGQLIECEQCHAKTKVARLVRLRCVDTTEVCWILTALDALPDPLLGDDVSLAQALSDRYQTLTGWHRVFVCDECYRTLSLVEHTGCVLHQESMYGRAMRYSFADWCRYGRRAEATRALYVQEVVT